MSLKLVMMGTGGFALPTFLGLYESRHQVVGLFTQPDRTGRGHHHHRNPMKEAALERGTPVLQPENANAPEALASLRELRPDLCVVAAYGQILRPELLSIPRLGAINVHASILPKHRGAAPIQYAILSGETETGVTIFQIEPRLDAGPILGIERTPIAPDETSGELEIRLAELSAPLVLQVIGRLEAGTAKPLPQDSTRATRAPRLKKSDGLIDWTRTPEQIDWQVRAMQPWPKAFTFLQPAEIDERPLRLIILEIEPTKSSAEAPAGTVIDADEKHLIVQAGGGALEIVRLQPEGKRPMSAAEFLCGHAVRAGDRFVALEG